MKSCNNCYWGDRCDKTEGRCKHYVSIVGFEHIAEKQYCHDLKKRDETYDGLIREQQVTED